MQTIYDRVEIRMTELGLNVPALTSKAQLSEKYLQQMKRFPNRNIRSDTARKIAEALETTTNWLLYGEDSETAQVTTGVPIPRPTSMKKDVPVYGTAAASHNGGAFQLDTGVIDYVRRPPTLETAKDIYALYVEGNSMEPQFWPGDLIFVHPHKPARSGDAVIIQEYDA